MRRAKMRYASADHASGQQCFSTVRVGYKMDECKNCMNDSQCYRTPNPP